MKKISYLFFCLFIVSCSVETPSSSLDLSNSLTTSAGYYCEEVWLPVYRQEDCDEWEEYKCCIIPDASKEPERKVYCFDYKIQPGLSFTTKPTVSKPILYKQISIDSPEQLVINQFIFALKNECATNSSSIIDWKNYFNRISVFSDNGESSGVKSFNGSVFLNGDKVNFTLSFHYLDSEVCETSKSVNPLNLLNINDQLVLTQKFDSSADGPLGNKLNKGRKEVRWSLDFNSSEDCSNFYDYLKCL